MRKFIFITAAALLGTLGLSACGNNAGQPQAAAESGTARPAPTAVEDALQACYDKHPEAKALADKAAAAAATSAASAASASAPAIASSTPTLEQPASEDNPCQRATIAASVWQGYMSQLVGDNMGNISNPPYAYFVPSSKYPENLDAIARVTDNLSMTVIATVLPGNMIAIGGPDSATTRQVLEDAFKQASPGSFKGVVVLFMGDAADEAAVKAAIEPSGATVKFAQM